MDVPMIFFRTKTNSKLQELEVVIVCNMVDILGMKVSMDSLQGQKSFICDGHNSHLISCAFYITLRIRCHMTGRRIDSLHSFVLREFSLWKKD